MIKTVKDWLLKLKERYSGRHWKGKYDTLLETARDLLYERDLKYSQAQEYYRLIISRQDQELRKLKSGHGGQFTQDELRSLLQLVHPDKHGGKDVAVRMAQKINSLRK